MVVYGIAALLSLAFAVVVITKLVYARRHFKMKNLMTSADTLEEMPSVTVCIPARNEMHAMTECLDRVIASAYPKMEIIVLDDASEDNTSNLIKAYAHAGVRFVSGGDLPQGWLGKNYALSVLASKASGRYMLFIDVDIRIDKGTVGQLVSYMQQEQASMLSVLPRRDDGMRASVIFSPLRYFWELMFHNSHKPASSSSVWMIEASTLKKLGGLEPQKEYIAPEARLAKALSKDSKYRFIVSSPLIGVTFEKKWKSQMDTSIRLIYPLLANSLLRVGMSLLASLIILIPLAAAVDLSYLTITAAACFYLLWAVIYGAYTRLVWRRGWWLGALLWPVIVVQEASLTIMSTLRHLTNTVTWKGRPIRAKPQ